MMEDKKRISIAFEESIASGLLRVNRMCVSNGTSRRMNAVPMASVTSVFRENGTAPEYMVILPLTRLCQAETFRATIQSKALKTGIKYLSFKDPHESLAQEGFESFGSEGFESPAPAVVVQVAVTREAELFIAGEVYSCDRNVEDTSFIFRSCRVSSDAEDTVARDTGVSAAFEFIRRHLGDSESRNVKVLLAADRVEVSRRVVKKLHQLLGSFEGMEISILRRADALKGALQPQPNRSRTADQHLRAAESALQRGDYPAAYCAVEAARLARPCEAVLSVESDFRARLQAAAATETGTRLTRFEASIEADPKRVAQLWQAIAVKASRGSHAKKDAQRIAKFLQGREI